MTRVTVIPDDQIVIVDGVPLNFQFSAPSNIHAIQWSGENGVIEYKVGGAVQAVIADIEPYIDAWNKEKYRIDHAVLDNQQPERVKLLFDAKAALAETDMVALRCFKAGVIFPASWQSRAVACRAIVNGMDTTSAKLPDKPEFPAGT